MHSQAYLTAGALLFAAVACREDLAGPTSTSESPGRSSALATATLTFRQVSVNWEHSCGVTTDDRAYCWGNNFNGELGAGTAWPEQSRSLVPVEVVGGLHFRRVSAGYSHTCGITTDSLLYCWGSDVNGELGRGGTSEEPSPVPAPVAGGLKFAQVSAGASFTCGVSSPERRAYCWGTNWTGQLGDGTSTTRTAPVRVAGDRRLRHVTAGHQHTCGVTQTGRMLCWGDNTEGQLGDSTRTSRLRPVAVGQGRDWRQVDAGGYHTCAVATNSVAYCWGTGETGQLGRGNRRRGLLPRRVQSDLRFASLDAGEYHTCGVAADRRSYCWGLNSHAQLGLGGSSLADQLLPAPVAGELEFRGVSAAFDHTCGVTTAGVGYCWGWNGHGRLGTGTQDDIQWVPAPVVGP